MNSNIMQEKSFVAASGNDGRSWAGCCIISLFCLSCTLQAADEVCASSATTALFVLSRPVLFGRILLEASVGLVLI